MASPKNQRQAMGSFKTLQTTERLYELCAERRDRELLKTNGPLREYKADRMDVEILRYFDKELKPKIKHDALLENQSISEPRNYGPRELDIGRISSPERTITIFIPITPKLSHPSDPQQLPKVMYQPDRDDDSAQEHMPWLIGTPVQISGNSRIVVKGPICFEMVQYDWEPTRDREGGGQNLAEAS